MRHLKIVILFFLILPAIAQAAESGYGYPISDAYEATILGAIEGFSPAPPFRIPIKRLLIEVIPNLKKPDVFFYDKGLRCTLAYQNRKAPLVFIIGGTGAGDQSHKSMIMMKQLYGAGFHVVTVPSPTHPNFIISASQSHIPGDLTEDAADIYRVMNAIWEKLQRDIEASEFYLCGYSLGATHAAFVAKLDEEQHQFNFRKVFMINPAVNLYDSITRIEALLDKIPGGPRKIGAYFNQMLSKFIDFYSQGDFVEINDEFFYALYKAGLFSNDEGRGIIGLTFRISLAGLIFSSDVMTNSGYIVPKNRVMTATEPLHDYFQVCIHLSFIDYFDEYFYPYFQKIRTELNREALIDASSLKSIETYLKSSDKFGVITNEDDFILSSEEIDYLRRLFGERIKVYPRGGHLGNIDYQDNINFFIGFFKQ